MLYRRVRRPRRTVANDLHTFNRRGGHWRPHNAKSLPNSYLLTPTSYLAYALHSQLSTLHSTAHKKNPKLSFRVLFILLQLKRSGIELIILAVFRNQLLMIAALDDMTELQHHNNVCV